MSVPDARPASPDRGGRGRRSGLRRTLLAAVGGAVLLAATPAPPEAPIADAAQRGDVDEVRALLGQGEDVNAAQGDGMTALHWAALDGRPGMAEVLVYAGASVRATTRLGAYTPLHLASRGGHAELVRILVDAGADADIPTSTGATPLHLAAASGDVEAVAVLVDHGADVSARDGAKGRTPLIFAAGSGRLEVVELLLARGADPAAASDVVDYVVRDEIDGVDRRRRNQILEARHEAEAEARDARAEAMVSVADEAAALLQSRGEEEPAPQEGREEEVPEEDEADTPGEEPDSAATERPQTLADSTAALLLGQEEPPVAERPDSAGAAGEEPGEVPDSLGAGEEAEEEEEAEEAEEAEGDEDEEEEYEVPPNVPESMGYTEMVGKQGGLTALHLAARDGHAGIARALLASGADLDQVTAGDRSSPLLVALINGHYDLALEFVERGADPNLASDDGVAPLFATLNNRWAPKALYPQPTAFKQQKADYLDVMRALLEAGADPDHRTEAHTWYTSYNFDLLGVDFVRATPFWRAAYATDVQAMKLLVEYGADPTIATMVPDGGRSRGGGDDDEEDPSGLPPARPGDPAVHPIHAASGVGYGTARAGNSHRHVPDGWLPAVRYLVEELGVDVNQRDYNGYSAVHHAAARGDNELIEYLVEKGADVTFVSRRGQTTVDMANGPQQRVQPFPETIFLLEGLGAKNNHDCRSC